MPARPAPIQAPPLPWLATDVLPALVPGGGLSRALLGRFAHAMRLIGLPVQPQRMRYDRRYARQCLTTAHGVGDAGLRALAMQLFEAYHGSDSGCASQGRGAA